VITLSRNVQTKYDDTPDPQNTFISAAAFFLVLLCRNNIGCVFTFYTPEEQQQIIALAQHLVDTGVA
jgi:hypothetical protein